MPTRLPIPYFDDPNRHEERRQIAESLADLHFTMGTIAENAKEFIPGEAVDEFETAWAESEDSMLQLVSDFLPRSNYPPSMIDSRLSHLSPRNIDEQELERHQLFGNVGKLKRATLARLKDYFFMFWNSSPHTEETRENARKAAVECLDYGTIFVSSIPGCGHVEELLSLGKKLVEFRINRGI